ncbi:MAG: OsmC family protein [Kordiimonas sp.]
MSTEHEYTTQVIWTGNTGEGTKTYKGYERSWDIAAPNKPIIHCSNDPLLGGDPTLMNPEDLLLSSLSACHMLWYLHLASKEKITVQSYEDMPVAIGETLPNGTGRFLKATLHPQITVNSGCNIERAISIHNEIHQYCFIARSVNFPISYKPIITEA